MWAKDAHIGRPDWYYIKLGLTASNLKNLHLKQSKFLDLIFDLEAIEAEVGGWL